MADHLGPQPQDRTKVLCLSNRLDHWKDIQIVVTFLAWDFNIPRLIVGLLRFKYWAK
jgi:hypothetical protein